MYLIMSYLDAWEAQPLAFGHGQQTNGFQVLQSVLHAADAGD